jgi:hypothetical protein
MEGMIVAEVLMSSSLETEADVSSEAHWWSFAAELAKGCRSPEVFQQRFDNDGQMSVDDWLGPKIIVKMFIMTRDLAKL